ncbi:MAG: hypothetical protein C0502_09035, partial [Opitutus sp.]|nr:hypothetical protein [Opitutus sp.]
MPPSLPLPEHTTESLARTDAITGFALPHADAAPPELAQPPPRAPATAPSVAPRRRAGQTASLSGAPTPSPQPVTAERQLRALVRAPPLLPEQVRRLCTCQGVGFITACTPLAELPPISDDSAPRALCAWSGLIPS